MSKVFLDHNSKPNKSSKYSTKSLKQALKEIREGEKGIRETCRKYGVPRTTIQDRLSGKACDELKTRGPEPVLGLDGEMKLVQWLMNILKCGFLIKKQELLDTVKKMLKDLGKPNPFKDDRPGQTWYNNFLRRNPVLSRQMSEATKKARSAVTEEYIRLWFSELGNVLATLGESEVLQQPERIFNAAECEFSVCLETGEIFGPRDPRKVWELKSESEKDNLSVLLTLNACGQICPPLVVFPYLRAPKAMSNNIPLNWVLESRESGCMKSDIFDDYIVNTFNSWVEQNNIRKPVLFLVDGSKAHVSMALSSTCEKLGIILYGIPPKATFMLQPAHVSVFDPLKANWQNIVQQNVAISKDVCKTVTSANFCQLFKEVIDDPQIPPNVINGFYKCGLYPFNPNTVDYNMY